MNNIGIITINETLCASVLGEVIDADQWICTLSLEDMERWLYLLSSIASDDEACWIAISVSMALYAREVGVYDFEADRELCKKILERFRDNLHIENNRRKGKCTVSHPLYLYKREGVVTYLAS